MLPSRPTSACACGNPPRRIGGADPEDGPASADRHGGLDANWFDKHGVPTVTIGAGQYEIHTVHEYVDLPEFAIGCCLAVALATLEG